MATKSHDTTQTTMTQEQLISYQPVENSPFTIVTKPEGAFLAMGPYKLTDDMETPDEVKDYIKENYWNLIVTVCTIVVDTIKKNENANTEPNLATS